MYLPVFVLYMFEDHYLTEVSLALMTGLLPVTYPRCCSLISCPDYLAYITDKKADRFFLLQCPFFSPLHVCVYARVFVRARLRSHDVMVTLPWLLLWHSCVQRSPCCCPGSHSAYNTDGKRIKYI